MSRRAKVPGTLIQFIQHITCPHQDVVRLILITFLGFVIPYTLHLIPCYAELSNGMDASLVVGQKDLTTVTANQGGSVGAHTISLPMEVHVHEEKLIVADRLNHRVLIYNSIPTRNNTSADVVIGQPDFNSNQANQGGGGATAFTHNNPYRVYTYGNKLIVCDFSNHRVLIYNSIPTSNGVRADVVIGQADFVSRQPNQGGGPAANTIRSPAGIAVMNGKLIISDKDNRRVLIYNRVPTTNDTPADVVIGQSVFTANTANQGRAVAADTLNNPWNIFSDGERLFICDYTNNRILIYNTLPVSNGASADIVMGQPDMNSNGLYPGGGLSARNMAGIGIYSDGRRMFISDYTNNRLLVYKQIPATNFEPADYVLGQSNFSSGAANRGGGGAANTLVTPYGNSTMAGQRLIVPDTSNNRILIFNLGTQSFDDLGPQFAQGKAVVGKVFFDWNANGIQDSFGPPSLKLRRGPSRDARGDLNGSGVQDG